MQNSYFSRLFYFWFGLQRQQSLKNKIANRSLLLSFCRTIEAFCGNSLPFYTRKLLGNIHLKSTCWEFSFTSSDDRNPMKILLHQENLFFGWSLHPRSRPLLPERSEGRKKHLRLNWGKKGSGRVKKTEKT